MPPATKGSLLRGYVWGSMVIVAPGVAPPATKGPPLRGYAWDSMVIAAPGVAPRLRNGRPYGAIRGAQWFLLPQGCTLHLYDVKG